MTSYKATERARAIAWKGTTSALPDDARRPAPYVDKDGTEDGPAHEFCLPSEHAELNLLPDVRDDVLALFAELRIPWHAGVRGGPSNHLLSSQVQCANALGLMVADRGRVRRAFAGLGVGDVLEIEPGRYLTFEYIGPRDYFDEGRGGVRVRGARTTSVDAAFKHVAADGAVELVLVEWKYTEQYPRRKPDAAMYAERHRRYADAVADPDGPVECTLLPFGALLDEPVYQLVRQQLLAHALEADGAEGASRVRVAHVLPPANLAYQRSVPNDDALRLGATVDEVWGRLLRRPDRFDHVNPAVFLDPEITSGEYVLRYAHDLVRGPWDLHAAFGAADEESIADALAFIGDVVLHDDAVELYDGHSGTGLSYPFRAADLHALSAELDP